MKRIKEIPKDQRQTLASIPSSLVLSPWWSHLGFTCMYTPSRQWHLKFSVNIGHIHLNHRPVTLVTNKHLDRFLLLIDILNCRSVFLSRVKYHISFNLLLTNKYYILFHLYLTLTFHLCHVNTIFSILPRWRWRYHGDAMERPDRWRITEEERKGCENR